MNQFLASQYTTDIQRGAFVGRTPFETLVEFNATRWNQFWELFLQELEQVEPQAQLQSTFETFVASTTTRVVPLSLQRHMSSEEVEVLSRIARTFGAIASVHLIPAKEEILIEFTTSRSAFLLYHYLQSLLYLADSNALTSEERLVKQSVKLVSLPQSSSGFKYGSTLEVRGTTGRPLGSQLMPYLDALFRLFQKESVAAIPYRVQLDASTGGRFVVQYSTPAEAFEVLQFLQAPLATWFGMFLSLVPK